VRWRPPVVPAGQGLCCPGLRPGGWRDSQGDLAGLLQAWAVGRLLAAGMIPEASWRLADRAIPPSAMGPSPACIGLCPSAATPLPCCSGPAPRPVRWRRDRWRWILLKSAARLRWPPTLPPGCSGSLTTPPDPG